MSWAALLLVQASLAATDPEPRFCPNRPDLGASACTTEPGRVLVEMSAVDWTSTDRSDAREDVVLAADLLIRFGVGPRTEVQVGWTPYGRARIRDKATGAVDVRDGAGDMRLAVRQNLRGNDDRPLQLALEPFVTLPVGRDPIGAGDWSGGLVLPVNYALSDDWGVSFTGDAAAAPDDDGDGHHLALGGALGLGRALGEQVGVVAEIAFNRERSAGALRTAWVTALSVGWQPRPGLQVDILGVAGLNRAAADLQLQLGGAILF